MSRCQKISFIWKDGKQVETNRNDDKQLNTPAAAADGQAGPLVSCVGGHWVSGRYCPRYLVQWPGHIDMLVERFVLNCCVFIFVVLLNLTFYLLFNILASLMPSLFKKYGLTYMQSNSQATAHQIICSEWASTSRLEDPYVRKCYQGHERYASESVVKGLPVVHQDCAVVSVLCAL